MNNDGPFMRKELVRTVLDRDYVDLKAGQEEGRGHRARVGWLSDDTRQGGSTSGHALVKTELGGRLDGLVAG